jgi:mono/diheme cytochrome c family protein
VRIILNIKTLGKTLGLGALAAVLIAGAVSGCATRSLPEPSAGDAVRAANLWPGTTVDDLHRGRQRYVQSCASCHGLIDPHQFPQARWPGFVKEMTGRLQLSSNDVQDLTRYLVVASQSPRQD